jgi:hypothetical protein
MRTDAQATAGGRGLGPCPSLPPARRWLEAGGVHGGALGVLVATVARSARPGACALSSSASGPDASTGPGFAALPSPYLHRCGPSPGGPALALFGGGVDGRGGALQTARPGGGRAPCRGEGGRVNVWVSPRQTAGAPVHEKLTPRA